MPLSTLIFDVDGTIAETERDGHRVAFNQAFAAVGLDWRWSVALYGKLLMVPGGKERIAYYWQQYQPQFKLPSESSQAAAAWIAGMHQRKTHYYRDRITQGLIPLRPGVKRLMLEARAAGIRLAIATTSALPNAMALIEKSLDPNWFEVIAAGDIVPEKKPAPDIYNYVLQQMQLAPEDCLVFEDSEPGLKASNQAGLRTVVTVHNYTQTQDFSTAQLVLDQLGEPEQPMHVLQGSVAGDEPCFTLETARSLLG